MEASVFFTGIFLQDAIPLKVANNSVYDTAETLPDGSRFEGTHVLRSRCVPATYGQSVHSISQSDSVFLSYAVVTVSLQRGTAGRCGVCMSILSLIISSFLQQLQTEDSMCTRTTSQSMKQERKGSFFKVSAPVIIHLCGKM